MSARAAWRLESIGFAKVYDYTGGKSDWGAFGLPLEGTVGPRTGEYARTDVPTCRLHERLPEVRARVRATAWDTCVVVNDDRIVLGRVGRQALAGQDDATVEEAMSAGPGTIRPNVTLKAIVKRMRTRNLTGTLVTRSDGTLIGLLRREDAERRLKERSGPAAAGGRRT